MLEEIIRSQELGPVSPTNFIRHAIYNAVLQGVPADTIVLLLLLPVVAAVIAGTRHLIGIRGLGIYLPATLSIVFLAVGPFMGIAIFILIITLSTTTRFVLKKLKSRLQYLPRMALILWVVVLGVFGVLVVMPVFGVSQFTHTSIFAVLFLILLSEEITRVQLGKSSRVAVDLGVETLILAFISYVILSLKSVQNFALRSPEFLLGITALFDFLIGKYVGLRLREIWRFRKLINGK